MYLDYFMKILHVNKFFYPLGGTEQYMFELMRAQEDAGHEVAVFAMQDPRNLPSPWSHYFSAPVATNSKLPITPATAGPRPGGGNYQLLKSAARFIYNRQAQEKFAEIIEAFEPDVVHLHNYYHQLSASILKILNDRKIPTVQTLHDYHLVDPTYKFFCNGRVFEDTKGGKYWKVIPNRCIQHSYAAGMLETVEFMVTKHMGLDIAAVDQFICPTQFLQKKIVEYGVNAEKTSVIYHPVFGAHHPDPALAGEGSPSQDPSVAQLPQDDTAGPRLGSNNKHILFIGRLSEEKGVEVLLSAMTRIDNPAIVLDIVGDGPMRKKLEQLATNLHLINVKFHGHQNREQVQEWYRNCQFVVLPSQWYEVSPLVIAEAALYGKPVIASDIGGLPELIENAKNGLLVAPTNIELWAQRIGWLCEHPNEITRMGENARAWTTGRTVEKHLQEIQEIYQYAITTKK